MGEKTAQTKRGGHHADNVPRSLLIAAGLLIGSVLAVTYYGRTTDVGAVHMPAAQPVQALRLFFVDQDDGGIAVTNADTGAVLTKLEPGTNGFLRSMMRGFVRARTRSDIGPQTPFTLTRWNTGTLSLTDETTGRRVDLDAFGSNQTDLFAKLFTATKATAP
jgi:putative photosynthetic complex assembly protein